MSIITTQHVRKMAFFNQVMNCKECFTWQFNWLKSKAILEEVMLTVVGEGFAGFNHKKTIFITNRI